MPVTKYRTALPPLLERPVIGPADLQAAGIPPRAAKKLLFVLARRGTLARIERGKYTALDDPLVVAGHITVPCYLSLWAALSLRRLTDQVPFAIDVVTTRRRFRQRILFAGVPIRFHTVPPRLFYGYEQLVRGDHRIPVARPEKVIIDALALGGVPRSELGPALRAADVALLRRYAALTRSKEVKKEVEALCSRKTR